MELDLFFYIFGLISIILIVMIIFILRKSTNMANLLFILSPLLFTTILIFNMLNYFGRIANTFMLWFPYLIAPLGMLLSSLYILQGPGFQKRRIIQMFLVIYIAISLIFSLYPNPIEFGGQSGLQRGLMHLLLIVPFSLTIFFFYEIAIQVPEEKTKIYSLVIGLFFIILGSILRGYDFISTSQDSTFGMIIIVLGSMLALLAFANVHRAKSVTKSVTK